VTTRVRETLTAALLAGLCCVGAFSVAVAQTAPAKDSAKGSESGTSSPNAFQGFSRDNKEPVKIESNSLEVRDKEKYALFIGNVHAQQGDSVVRCRQLKVFYDNENASEQKDKAAPPAKTTQTPKAKAGPAVKTGENTEAKREQRIRRLEASGGVIVTRQDHKATGDFGVFDMPTNTATITGNVVVTQGLNVMRGEKLVVDLNTGLSRIEPGGKNPTRVQGLFIPSNTKDSKEGKDGKAGKDGKDTKAGKPRKSSQPQQPLQLQQLQQ
jgi:lipopolysaccharide export system protein LptA